MAYYVTSFDDQNQIIALIADFLAGKPYNQGKIAFYEAENWKTWFSPETGVTGGSRGEERLLREVHLNC